MYGSNPNIESGSASAISISSLIFDQINREVSKIKSKPVNILTRVLNFSIIQNFFGGQIYATIPHEYFGHYLVARNYGIRPELRLNFPALGGDNIFEIKQSIPVQDRMRIVAAGVEVTAMIAHQATRKLYSGSKSPSYSGNFLLAGKILDQYLYLEQNVKPFLENPNRFYDNNANYFNRNPVPNDPLSYILALTESYGYYSDFLDENEIWLQRFSDMSQYTDNEFIKDQYRRMKKAFLFTLLDPTNLYYLIGNSKYLIKGQTFFQPLMINFQKLSIIPGIRANLGPLGVENYYDLFFLFNQTIPLQIYYRNGGNLFHAINGMGAIMENIPVNSRLKIGCQGDFWRNQRNLSNHFNFDLTIRNIDRKNFLTIIAKLGFKSAGSLMGKPFDKGVYGYLGLGLNLTQPVVAIPGH